MTRFLLAAGATALLLTAPVRGLAGDAATSAAPSADTAPGQGGCMPGGQCCGGGSCTMNEGDAAGSEGGCPCKRRKALQEKAAKLRAAEQQQSAPANP
jgi:hypothetical protein